MSTKSDKSKRASRGSKIRLDLETGDQNEPVSEGVVENPADVRTIVITINSFSNILPLYSVADVRVSLKYLDQDLGESQAVPVTDDEHLPVNQCFEIPIDLNSPKQLDLMASYPVFVSTIQSSGVLDSTLYEHLQPSEEASKPVEEVESLFSLYEAVTGEAPTVHLKDLKKPKTDKKQKSDKTSGKKNKSRTKSATSQGSEKVKGSKGSLKKKDSSMSRRSETPVIKSEVYGMCVIDFIPLFFGEPSFSESLLVQPIKRSCQILSTFKNFPKIDVTVSIKDNLKFIDVKNILYFTVESLCNVPTLMSTDMDCRVCVLLPLQNNDALPTVFYNPKITTKAPNEQVPKRWPGIHDIGYNANTTKYLVDADFNDITNKSNLNLEEGFRDEVTRLEFNYVKRNILFKNSNNDFAARLFTHKKLVLEIYLTPKSGKRNKSHHGILDDSEDIVQTKKGSKMPPYLHLMAVLDVVALLYPGCTKLHTATPVTSFTFEEAAKWGLEDSFFMPKPRTDPGTGRGSKSKIDMTKKKKAEKKDKPSKKDQTSTAKEDKNLASQLPSQPEEPPPPEPSVQVYNEEGKPCFIIVEIELLRPIKPKRDAEELKSELYHLQLEALQTTKTILSKHVADDLYKQTIREIIDDLNKNWIHYNDAMKSIPRPDYGDFLGYLQKIGAYQTYLNSITTSATLLISNKYKCEENDFKNSKTYQNLISELFTDLISQMHGILNSLVCSGMKPLLEKYTTPEAVSFFYAKEAAELKLYGIADRYFLERIINNQNGNPKVWFDYAIYNIEINDTEKAFECIKESIAINCTNKYALLLFAALLTDKGSTHDAETCLLNLMVLESKWSEGWCVLYLFYQKCGRADGTEMAMDMARKLFEYTVVNDVFLEFEDLAWSSNNIPNTLFFRTAVLLLKMRLYSWVELALAEEVLVSKHYGYVNYLLAVISYYRKDFDHALEHIKEAKEYLGADFAILALSGHVLLCKDKLEEAKDEYFRIIESYDRPDDIHLVYVNCADILAILGDHQKARSLILTTCKTHQTPLVWFSAGKLYFLENDMLSAEECFNETNMKDNRHAEAWGYLTLVNLKLNRTHEAEQCYQQAIKSKLDNEGLNKAIIDEFNKAKSLYSDK